MDLIRFIFAYIRFKPNIPPHPSSAENEQLLMVIVIAENIYKREIEKYIRRIITA